MASVIKDRHLLTRLTVEEQRRYVAVAAQSCSIELLEQIAIMLYDSKVQNGKEAQ